MWKSTSGKMARLYFCLLYTSPEDWQSWSLDKRRMFWAGSITGELKLVPRDKVCALEVWCEALGGSQKEMKYADTREINGILETAEGWARSKNGIRCGYCGLQRGFIRGV